MDTTQNPLSQHENAQLARLERLLTSKNHWTLCFLIFETSHQRDGIRAAMSEALQSIESITINAPDRYPSPEGSQTLVQAIGHSKNADNPVFIYGTDREITMFAGKSPELWALRSGVFNFSEPPAADTARPADR